MADYRILVTGSRDWTNKDVVHAALLHLPPAHFHRLDPIPASQAKTTLSMRVAVAVAVPPRPPSTDELLPLFASV